MAAAAHPSCFRENLTLILFAAVVLAGFIVVGIDVGGAKAPAAGVAATPKGAIDNWVAQVTQEKPVRAPLPACSPHVSVCTREPACVLGGALGGRRVACNCRRAAPNTQQRFVSYYGGR